MVRVLFQFSISVFRDSGLKRLSIMGVPFLGVAELTDAAIFVDQHAKWKEKPSNIKLLELASCFILVPSLQCTCLPYMFDAVVMVIVHQF